jgi:hypothetical protein
MDPVHSSEQEAARLKELFQDVNPPEITNVDLGGKTFQEIFQLLPPYGGENPVFGILVTNEGRAYGLRSGWALIRSEHNGILFQKGNVSQRVAKSAGVVWERLGFHVEAQAAAFMRKAEITEAVLYINANNPCYDFGEGCFFKLPIMLAEGTRLTVVNKWGNSFPFLGDPD